MNLESKPTQHLEGEIICPGDKSISQRILIIGSLLNCDMEIEGFLDAYDPNSTLSALNKIGASIKKNNNNVTLTKRSNAFIDASEELDLGNSGTGVRLMLGLVSGLGINANFIGDSSLSKNEKFLLLINFKSGISTALGIISTLFFIPKFLMAFFSDLQRACMQEQLLK